MGGKVVNTCSYLVHTWCSWHELSTHVFRVPTAVVKRIWQLACLQLSWPASWLCLVLGECPHYLVAWLFCLQVFVWQDDDADNDVIKEYR